MVYGLIYHSCQPISIQDLNHPVLLMTAAFSTTASTTQMEGERKRERDRGRCKKVREKRAGEWMRKSGRGRKGTWGRMGDEEREREKEIENSHDM